LHFRENFRYFRQFSLWNVRENENKFSRKCENENFRFNPTYNRSEICFRLGFNSIFLNVSGRKQIYKIYYEYVLRIKTILPRSGFSNQFDLFRFAGDSNTQAGCWTVQMKNLASFLLKQELFVIFAGASNRYGTYGT
jgi:hypothetical protein